MHKQQAWEYCQAKPIQTLERASQGVNWSWSQCIKSHHTQTSSGKGLPSHFWNRNIIKSELPWLRRKWTRLLLSGPESSFQMKVNFAFHLEIKVPESGGREERHRIHVAWSPVWSFHSQCWFGLPCHLLVLVHCVFWSPQSTQPSTRKFKSTPCFLLLTSFMKMLILFSSRTWHMPTLPKVPKAGSMTMAWSYCAWLASKLTWPPWYCQEEDERHQTQQCRWPEGRYQSNLGFITPEQCHRLIASMPRRIDAVIHAKEGSNKYWVHRNEHTFQKPNISV